MSHILNRSGAETDLFSNLAQKGIHRFSSVDDLFVFKRNYLKEIDDFRERTAPEVREEIETKSLEIASLHIEYEQLKSEQKELLTAT